MKCSLLDVQCHVLAWFWSLPWYVHWGLVALAVLAVWGIAARLWSFAKGIGGWQAAVAALGAVGLILVAVWPKAAHKVATEGMFPHLDGEQSVRRARVKGKKPDPMREDWMRRPGENAAEWQERVSKTK